MGEFALVLFCTAGVEKKKKVNTIHLIFSWYSRSGAVAHPYPEEPDAHVADASHRCDYKVHSNDCDQNVIQGKHL